MTIVSIKGGNSKPAECWICGQMFLTEAPKLPAQLLICQECKNEQSPPPGAA